jgi:hypothetical protein
VDRPQAGGYNIYENALEKFASIGAYRPEVQRSGRSWTASYFCG